jgi:hypothetical protein
MKVEHAMEECNLNFTCTPFTVRSDLKSRSDDSGCACHRAVHVHLVQAVQSCLHYSVSTILCVMRVWIGPDLPRRTRVDEDKGNK